MPKKYRKTNHKKRNKHNRTVKRRITKKRGGLFGALRGAVNSGDEQIKYGQENISYKTTVKKGMIFNKKLYNIEYIIPNNYVLLRDPNSTLTPRFNVYIGENAPEAESCYIQITNPQNPKDTKFVEFFICIEGDWYCMMRVFGINTGMLATVTNIIFYRIANSWFDLKTNKITFWDNDTRDVSMDELNLIQKSVLWNKGRIVRILPNAPANPPKQPNPITLYKEITSKDGDIYYVLRQFRNAQLINAGVKEEILEEVTEKAIGFGIKALLGIN